MKQFKNYDRLFTFGCSMTNYFWPTWADIIAKEVHQHYNYGKSGGGNLFISNSIIEANKKHKFTDKDLVLVLWSSISREDRYKNGQWETPGNIYTQNQISMQFVHEWSDNRFYLIRDLGIIEMSSVYLDSIPSYTRMMNMSPLISLMLGGDIKEQDKWYKGVLEFYKDTVDKLEPNVVDTVYNGRWPQTPIRGHGGKGQTADYHPTPMGHLKYIETVFSDFEITDTMRNYAAEAEEKVLNCKTLDQVENIFPQTRLGRL